MFTSTKVNSTNLGGCNLLLLIFVRMSNHCLKQAMQEKNSMKEAKGKEIQIKYIYHNKQARQEKYHIKEAIGRKSNKYPHIPV